jgi:hypothetical protein
MVFHILAPIGASKMILDGTISEAARFYELAHRACELSYVSMETVGIEPTNEGA